MEEKYTKEEAKIIKAGLIVAVAILLVMGLFMHYKSDLEHKDGGRHYPLKASFGRTDGLLVGDKVRLAGVDVGRITHAVLDENFHAILTLEIREDVKIPDDSSASIVSSGLMGPKYIEIEPGGSEEFLPEDGAFSYTQDSMVLEELLDRIIGIGKSNRTPKERVEMEEFERNINL